MLKHAAAVALAVVAAQVTALPAATAAPAERPLIEVQRTANNVFVDGDTAYATGKYRCDESVAMSHVWVSVKQGGEDLEGHGSGGRSTSWYDTNISLQAEPELTCNGGWQHLTVPLGRHPSKQALQRGPAYLQFCVYVMTADGTMADASENTWVKVKA